MGYSTNFSLELVDVYDPKIEDAIIDKLKDLDVIYYALNEDLSSYEAVNWYDYENDMLSLSRAFPDVHFILHGLGAANEDIWDHHFIGGKAAKYRAEIFIPPLNMDDLE